jgi:beta-lactam-binding protein with PASTA domain
VPLVVGMAQTAALAAIRATGLVPGNIANIFDCNHIGQVTGQSPTAGTQVLLGWPVNITVGSTRDPTNPRRVCQ